jgi:transposase
LRVSNRHHRSSPTATPHKERGQLERENERLSRENEQLQQELIDRDKKLGYAEKRIADAEKQISDAEKQIAESEKQIADLERQLGLRRQNSTTSSKPPSSDGLAGEQRERGSKRKKSCRKPGGQPGHPGRWRGLAPAERVNQVIDLLPARCRHCDCRFPDDSRKVATQGDPRRHQVTELPRIEAHITEYRCQNAVCPECAKNTQAELPPALLGHFGPDLTALIAYLTVVCRMPRRVARELLEQVLGIPLSLGSIQNSWEEASEAVAEPCAELEKQLPLAPVINSDETGYRTNGEKRWLWALVAPAFVFYKIALTRGTEVLVQLLGAVFAGILCSDRYSAYVKYHQGEGQFCWAHFKRNILGVQQVAKTTDAERFCRDALALHARLFRLWHRFRAGPDIRYGPVTREQLIAKSIPLEKKFFALADRHAESADKDVRNLALALLKHFEKFFAFLRNEGVEPTNNAAERALRCAVQWRKTSFGSRSAQGEVAVARLLTVKSTCRMQSQEPLRYLGAAIRAHRHAHPVPSMLKTASTT